MKIFKISSFHKSVYWLTVITGHINPGFRFYKKGLSFKRIRRDCVLTKENMSDRPQFATYIFWFHLRHKTMDIDKNYARQARKWFKSKQ